MRRCVQQGSGKLVTALLTLFATTVYLLTMDRSASWWDCGEFIATSWTLGVGHPPGAPFYQLVAHCMMLLSMGNALLVAPLSNALSALCGGITVGLLYLTIIELGNASGIKPAALRLGAAVGALCYLFCDTAWFSAVESEVYAMAMLFCSLDVYLMLRWRRSGNARLLPLVALLLGLGVCVHLMTLLVTPALVLVYILGTRRTWLRGLLHVVPLCALFFVLGLTPYAIVPLRAAANPTINEGNPSTVDAFRHYMQRDQYAKAPLYPRMWREKDSTHWDEWTLGTHGIVGNVVYYLGYQLTYMYGRYLMYNFIGRENFHWNCVVLFVLPALLGGYGLWRHRRRQRDGYWVVMLLFLFGGVILNLYLNHPCYEPRERDYAYVLSFYAVAIWIGIGAAEMSQWWRDRQSATADNDSTNQNANRTPKAVYVLFLAPLLMAVGNWSDHDRSRCHSVHDIAEAHLQSCDHGAVLITLGDNDTFPLWYLQQVEGCRTDVTVYNIGLTGFQRTMDIMNHYEEGRPVYVSYYFFQRYADYFAGRLRCEGYCWRLLQHPADGAADDHAPLQRHLRDSIRFHITGHEYVPRVSKRLLDVREKYWTSASAESR